MSQDLFSHFVKQDKSLTPLADRMRPVCLEQIFGQRHLLGKGKFLQLAILTDAVPSVLFFGPPGTGKTTLARVIAKHTGADFVSLSAVGGSVKEVREILNEAKSRREFYRKKTILFIDEIHRFNKTQQDALLPGVEQGVVIFIGATTENPSFSVVPALLSRCRVLELFSLEKEDVEEIVKRAVAELKKQGDDFDFEISGDVIEFISEKSRGDARYALGLLDSVVQYAKHSQKTQINLECAQEASQSKALLYDKSGEEHYNVVSAFIKSMRGSDPDAALYWMFRMLEAGEDPLFVLRRMIIFASEDIGNADPRALTLVMAADQAFARVGMPEGVYPLAQACTYLASAPKSNAMVEAIGGPRSDIKRWGALEVPRKLRNAPTKLMKDMGYGKGYRYPPNEGGYAPGENYLPDKLKGKQYYVPSSNGLEQKIAQHLKNLRQKN